MSVTRKQALLHVLRPSGVYPRASSLGVQTPVSQLFLIANAPVGQLKEPADSLNKSAPEERAPMIYRVCSAKALPELTRTESQIWNNPHASMLGPVLLRRTPSRVVLNSRRKAAQKGRTALEDFYILHESPTLSQQKHASWTIIGA